VEENVKNHVPILNHLSGCQHMNYDNTQEWMNQDKEQQLTDNTVYFLIHADDDHLNYDNGAEKLGKMSHIQGLNVTHATTAYIKQQRGVTVTQALA
jgi:hypothetical protein